VKGEGGKAKEGEVGLLRNQGGTTRRTYRWGGCPLPTQHRVGCGSNSINPAGLDGEEEARMPSVRRFPGTVGDGQKKDKGGKKWSEGFVGGDR